MSTPPSPRLHVIACGVLGIDIRSAAEARRLNVTLDCLPGGLHNRPTELRLRLQEAIDTASTRGDCDRIIIGYGLCGRGTVGIHARGVGLVIPKVHDCIALFLGSDAAYREQFQKYPGTYYISAGWYEEKVQPQSSDQGAPGRSDGNTPPTLGDDLETRYGQENADAIRHFMNSWQRNYQRAAFIDTGAPHRRRYADHAAAMAQEFGWLYEELPGSGTLIEAALSATETDDEILVVPPEYVTAYDAMTGALKAVPAWTPHSHDPLPVVDNPEPDDDSPDDSPRQGLGLGIDAGGTYTDAVVLDFASDSVLAKSKALTTKWDFTLGICEALDAIEPDLLEQVGLVSVSTTLATNAIVEGYGQTVGLLLMPPYGLFDPSDVPHTPTQVLRGQLEIDGREREPIDPEQVARVAREMVARNSVGAFAVSGFAGTVNPEHELAVKKIVRETTGLSVTCGHELSELLNFRTRAITAVLNARIIPQMQRFLTEAQAALAQRGIEARMMVVKGDGSLINAATAREKPVETILSGPAASVAGARYLTARPDALVVDVGGTTTDTAALRGGRVAISDSGTRVGGHATHVRALEMRTVGLGGDSILRLFERKMTLGPLRVGPVSWLARSQPQTHKALDDIERHVDDVGPGTGEIELIALSGSVEGLKPTEHERQILRALAERPFCVRELSHRIGQGHWSLLRLSRLAEHHAIVRCGLTPTDLLHVDGLFDRWDSDAARRLAAVYATLQGTDLDTFVAAALEQVVHSLAMELVKKQIDSRVNVDGMDDCPACAELTGNLLTGGSDEYTVSLKLKRPVIGIGAPVHYFLPRAAKLLSAEAIIPHDADVANAIGAISSNVTVSRTVTIRPDDSGRYAVDGLPGAPTFVTMEEAHHFAVVQIRDVVRQAARDAGTAETRVQTQVRDHIANTSDGMEVFLRREIAARLSGRPGLGHKQHA